MAKPTREDLNRRAANRASAARSVLARAGLAIEEVDEHHWRVAGHLFWPGAGFWKRPDGSPGGKGVLGLIAAIQEAAKGSGPPPQAASDAG